MAETDEMHYLDRIALPWRSALESVTGPLDPFDAHTHLGENDPDEFSQTAEQLLQGLGAAGARATTFASAEPDGYGPANDRIIADAIASDGVLVPYARLDPAAEPLAEAERCLAAGARGIKLHPRAENFELSHPAVDGIFALAHEQKLPVLIHAGRGIPSLGQDAVDLARKYPGARVILAHAAVSDLSWLCDEIGGIDNLFIDTSWWNPADLMAVYSLVPPSHILWASDSPYGRPLGSFAFLLRPAVQAGLGPEAMRSIAGGQLERILAGDDPADLGPAPARPTSVDPLLDRVESHLVSAMGRAFARTDPAESVSLARLACNPGAKNYGEVHARILDMLVEVESGEFEPVKGVPFPPELGILIWILQLARTPDVPVPEAP